MAKTASILSSLILSATLTAISLPPFSTQAQISPTPTPTGVSFNPPLGFTPPSDRRGEPRTVTGTGGTRGTCSEEKVEMRDLLSFSPRDTQPQLTAIIPATKIGLTTREQPDIFIFIPATTTPMQGEFLLKDESGNREIYFTTFTSPDRAGIIRLQLPLNPETGKSYLEADRKYQWSVHLSCKNDSVFIDNSGNTTVGGWIQRIQPDSIAPTFTQELETLSPLQQAALYGKHGIWHELLATLANLQESPDEKEAATAALQELFASEPVQLEPIAGVSLLNCCETSAE
ncbi:DUF928 domain-containing protein [Lusitaniella coriacea LEGE 07157]|uniref:DUF928 domain-containing protein n=1 Tax=Lusitaniella coriacea LEGE 07157 TaxID=945747 RepID=A0A8J7DW67_9CYAN|nr:DUF928 domain-containing protein [Lusitaniella coriacea]MBE9116251.1 DUF928 domain-containing protein [Lusitaniella coriacea LEGE 07157]